MTTVQELFDLAKEAGFEELAIVEPGVYDLELAANPTKKGDGIFVKGRITEGPGAGKMVGCGSLTFNNNPNAVSISLQNLSGMGLGQEELNKVAAQFGGNVKPWLEAVAKLINGRKVKASIVHNEYLGQVRTQFEIGRIQLVSAPPPPALGGGVPAAAPAAAAPAAAAPVVTAPAAAPAAAPAPVTEAPVAAVAATGEDPGF